LADRSKGLFITFEGGEGTGKSTQLKRLAAHLAARGIKVATTREPGGTPEAEALRSLLVNGEPGAWSAEAEALLNYAARDSHLREVIRPALMRQELVLCDRFMDSTRAYQGYAGGCDLELIDRLENTIVAGTRPDLTFVFDLDPAIGLQRARQRNDGTEDRFERKGLAFHQELRQGFLAIAKSEPMRCQVIDAGQSVDKVAAAISEALEKRTFK
jgi:dTMP kinase